MLISTVMPKECTRRDASARASGSCTFQIKYLLYILLFLTAFNAKAQSFDLGVSALYSPKFFFPSKAKVVIPFSLGVSNNKLAKTNWGYETALSYFRFKGGDSFGDGFIFSLGLTKNLWRDLSALVGIQSFLLSIRESVPDKETIAFLDFRFAPVLGVEYTVWRSLTSFLVYSLPSFSTSHGQWQMGLVWSIAMFE